MVVIINVPTTKLILLIASHTLLHFLILLLTKIRAFYRAHSNCLEGETPGKLPENDDINHSKRC